MNKKLFALLITVLTVAACDATESPDTGKPPTETAGQSLPMEKSVKHKSDATSEENCPVYFEEVAQICHESIYNGLDISCSTAFMSAEIAFSQQQGELFKDPNGKVSASEIGNAVCATSLKSLRKKRNKAAKEPRKDWGPKCTSFMERLVSSCITPIAKGEFGASCSTVLSRINSLKRNKSPENLCESFSGLLPK